MTTVKFRSDMTAQLIDSMGNDASLVKAMMVSTQGVDALEAEAHAGRLNFLMKNRHGTPFEHGSMTFYIEAPIFVFREFHRHRIGWSYNEVSGRYTQLPPMYYIPAPDRNLVQVGKPGQYEFVPGLPEDYQWLKENMMAEAITNYVSYERRLEAGIAKEVARMSLGVNIYTAMFATCNPRSLMAFLSLRTKREPYMKEWNAPDEWRSAGLPEKAYTQSPGGSLFPSYPMREIEMVSEQMEDAFSILYPMTWDSFNKNGRVSP